MNSQTSWPEILGNLLAKRDLTRTQAAWAMGEIMAGRATDSQVGGFLLALRSKGETAEEISGFVDVMLEHSVKVPVSNSAVDIVGTGGDQLGTVNISTMAAIVTAAAGYPVLKHGSRSASGRTGSSEFLEALGVKLDLSPERITEVFEQTGIVFFFAPLFHPALKNVVPIRKELGVPTTFNFLGPLANPVQPIATALGVANQAILPVVVGELVNRGRTAIVFRGNDGLDELTTTGTSQLYIIKDKVAEEIEFSPRTLGISLSRIDDLIGGDAEQNAKTAKAIFAGELGENPIMDIVCLNAAAAMTAFDLAQNTGQFDFQATMVRNYSKSREAILAGKAALKLSHWVEETNK